jgi:SAM-dependent methyltransferase
MRVGGRWRQMGEHQRDFLVGQGLEPDALFLDVGCGALRAGIPLVEYLEPGGYYGIDINQSLLDAGYEVEMPAELRGKLPRDHLRATDRFDCDFGVTFDWAIAQSLFTHIALNDIRLCLYRVAKVMRPGGRFYVTIFEAPQGFPVDGLLESKGTGKAKKYGERNPFWYWASDIEWAAGLSPWSYRYIGDWAHPRGQHMIELTRTE